MKSVLSFIIFLLLLSSCSTSNNVVSNFGIQKRKYTKGWFIPKSKSYSSLKKDKISEITTHQSFKKEKRIEKIKPKIQFKRLKINQNSSIFSHKKRTIEIENIKTKTPKVDFVIHEKIKLFSAKKHNKRRIKPHRKKYEDKHILIKIGLITLGIVAIFGVIALLLYLSTLSFVLSYIFGILIGIIALISVGVSGLGWALHRMFTAYGDYYYLDLIIVLGWVISLIFTLLLFFTPFILFVSPVILILYYIFCILIGIEILTFILYMLEIT